MPATNVETIDLAAYQKKISRAGEMKTAIREFLDWWDLSPEHGTPEGGVKLVKALRKSMTRYNNAG